MMTWERTIEGRATAAGECLRRLRASAFAKAVADRLALLQQVPPSRYHRGFAGETPLFQPGRQKERSL